MSTVRRWLKRVRKSDPSAWENNVRLVSQVNTGLTKGLTTGLTKGLNGQAEYQEYTIRELFLLDRLGVGNRVVNDQGVDQGVEQGGISPGKDQAGPDPGQPVHQDQPGTPGPGLTFSDYAWLIGQGIKRLLNSKVF